MPNRKTTKAPASAGLLVELLTEELPPKSLARLGEAFASGIAHGLRSRGLLISDSVVMPFVTPRRLAVSISHVLSRGADKPVEQKLMPLSVARGSDGRASEVLKKKLATIGRAHLAAGFPSARDGPDSLYVKSDGKAESAYLSTVEPGWTLVNALQRTLHDAIEGLPIPKVMSYQLADGEMTEHFARPAHGLVALHGNKVVDVSVLGLKAGVITRGHRFLACGPIAIKSVDDYESVLREKGKVEASFAARRSRIKGELKRVEDELAREIARKPDGRIPVNVGPIVIDTERADPPAHIFPQALDFEAVERAIDCSGGTALLDEVTALVEWPRAYWGHFDEQFLEVPVECLALTMKRNQKYFPIFDTTAKLLPYFVVIGNNDESLAKEGAKQIYNNIVSGNERVLRPRLADARFFYDEDRKTRLEERVPKLAKVVYHNKLGNLRDRTDRIKLLAGKIIRDLGGDSAVAERAAELSKADLLTGMVGEFPELQGVMGRYYALYDGEPEIVANAIEAHYRPRFSGDWLPQGLAACSVALADKLDILVGIFGIGQTPTGDKDPFSLRRHALGIVRILMETPLAADLNVLLAWAREGYNENSLIDNNVVNTVYAFIIERLRNYEFLQNAFETEEIEAVASQNPTRLDTVINRLSALQAFRMLREAPNLAAANKRIKNILRQANYRNAAPQPDLALAREPAEISLIKAVQKLGIKIDIQLSKSHEVDSYVAALKALAAVREPVDKFFDDVMVMIEDIQLRENRLATLSRLSNLMNRVADISKLAVEK